MTNPETITIDRRFRGPARSGNGGYVCGRVAAFIPGVARVRLRVPPPLDAPLEVRSNDAGVVLVDGEGRSIAEGWPAELDLEIPPSPGIDAAREASRHYVGFDSHRFSTCFVCGTDREPVDALRVYAGPVGNPPLAGKREGGPSGGAGGKAMVACVWTPDPSLAPRGRVEPVYVWCVLDCPGGFSFPHPEEGTILLGELTVSIGRLPLAGEPHVVTGWEIEARGRKHFTGTALYTAVGECLAFGYGVWFEVPEL